MGQAAAIVVYGRDSQQLAPVCTEAIIKQVKACLVGSNLTFDRLITDLGAYFTANPIVAAKAKPAGVYNCLITAARYQTTFGDGGLWIIPDGDDVRPQESEKHMTQAAYEAGWELVDVVFIHSSHGAVQVLRGDGGEILSFTLANDDITAAKTPADMLGAFGVAHHRDGRKFIKWFPRADLDARRDHSAAAKAGKAPAWRDEPMAMYARSVRAAVDRLLVPIRTKVPGMAGSLALPGGMALDAEYSEVPEVPVSRTDAVTRELSSRPDGSYPPPSPEPKGNPEPHPMAPENPPAATKPGKQLSPFPTIPAAMEKMVEENQRSGLDFAIRDFRGAWPQLPRDPKALQNAYQSGGREWASGESPAGLRALGELKNLVFAAAKAAGYPQE